MSKVMPHGRKTKDHGPSENYQNPARSRSLLPDFVNVQAINARVLCQALAYPSAGLRAGRVSGAGLAVI